MNIDLSIQKYQKIYSEWDHVKNNILPQEISYGSGKMVWWICPKGHSYQQKPNQRTSNSRGCPYCSNTKVLIGYNDLFTTHPHIAKEWSPNNTSSIYDKTCYSKKKVLWICKNGHKYSCSLYHRCRGVGCPICTNKRVAVGINDIITTHPELALEWDYTQNKIMPTEIVAGSHKIIWWRCSKGHSYKQVVKNKVYQHQGCPICSNKKVLIGFNDIWTTHTEICEELLNKEDGYKYSFGSGKKVSWKCKKCQYIWITSIAERLCNNKGCPKCNRSYGEKKIEQILSQYNVEFIREQTFEGCKDKSRLKFDFYLPDYNVLIEYQGQQHYPGHNTIFHPKGNRYKKSDLESIQKRDQIKRDFCQNEGIKLIEIPYWEYKNIETIITNLVIAGNQH